MAESLAGILAGSGANPYQQPSQGIAPLLSQFLLNQQLAQGQLGQQPAGGAPAMPQPQGQGMPMGLGMMQPATDPQTAALLQAIKSGQNQGQ